MASISAIGYLPKPLTLHVGKASIMRRRTSFQKPEKFCNFNVSSSFVGCEDGSDTMDFRRVFERRRILVSVTGILAGAMCNVSEDGVAVASDFTDMPAIRGKDYGKLKMRYPDYTETKSGLQYKVTYWKTREFSCVSICTTNTRAFNYFILIPNSKRMQDLRAGSGPIPKMGETVVVDWDGYTIGYYGRIFEARNKTKGGSFEGGEKEFFKFRIGSQQVIPAFEEAVTGMALGGIRRIIVPPELGYPENDYNKSGPRPTTFSGQRALDFVLKNQGLIDKTLLFDIELLKIIPN